MPAAPTAPAIQASRLLTTAMLLFRGLPASPSCRPTPMRRLQARPTETVGSYHLLTFTAEPEALEEVSRVLKIPDGVMRHLAVRRTASATGPTRPLETRVEQRQDSGQQASPVGRGGSDGRKHQSSCAAGQ